MNYNLTDNLPAIRVGDTLTLEDGSVHIAKRTQGKGKYRACLKICSIVKRGVCRRILCDLHNFHFKQANP